MKKFIALVLLLVTLLSLAACDNSAGEAETTEAPVQTTGAPETDPPFDFTSYKNSISICTDKISKNVTLLSIVALYEQNYWEAAERLDSIVTPEELTSGGYEYLEENTDYSEKDITNWHDTIMSFYVDIVSTDIDGTDAEALAEVFNEYFDAYLSLYNLATSPSGEREDFVDSYESYTSVIENCEIKLDALMS